MNDNTVCGGCGNSDPEKRCLGCLHSFSQEKKIDLSELFPNSPENAFKRIIHQDRHNSMDVKIVQDALKAHAFNNSPITIETICESKPNKRRTYHTKITRSGNSIENGFTYIAGYAAYNTALWKHILLGHDKPNINNFDVDPNTNDCVACGAPNSPRDLGSGGPYRCSNCIIY